MSMAEASTKSRVFSVMRIQIPGRVLVALLVSLLLGLGLARQVLAADDFLDPEAAFKGDMRALDARHVEVTFDIAPGYYLYQERFKIAATGATLGTPEFPHGKVKFDETFQKNVETHRGLIRIIVPVEKAAPRFALAVDYQGCADKGLCYPPAQMRADVSLAAFGGDGSVAVKPGRDMPDPDAPGNAQATGDSASSAAQKAAESTPSVSGLPAALPAPSPSERSASPATSAQKAAAAPVALIDDDGTTAALRSGTLWQIVGVFFVAGLLLSLTPCVLPMVPILSSIIVGHGAKVGRARGFSLAVAYSLGMALVYTAFGVAAGLVGQGLAAALQNAWVLGAFAIALVILSLSMFGAYELQLPASLTGPLTHTSQHLPGGRFLGVFAMGGISALIVSPCVAAPLAAALLFLSQTHDVWLGGSALFSLAIGMSVPLLVVGASAGTLLPRGGAWMDGVKRFFGALLLGVAIYTIQPVLPGEVALALWGALLAGGGAALLHGASTPGGRAAWARQAAGAVLGVIGVLQLVGAASGGTDPLQPLKHFAGRREAAAESRLAFSPVRTVAELDAAIGAASTAGRPVMLDFYADWCVSCKEMERFTFADANVRRKLAAATLLRADVTVNSAEDRALLKRFDLFGPPGMIFFDARGQELTPLRVIGYQDSKRFLVTLAGAGL